jgi:uroporphyrinogen decarboxylase
MTEMTSRERVLTAIEHREPDRIPIDFAQLQYLISARGPYGYDALAEYLGVGDPEPPIEMFGMVLNPDPRIKERLGNDFIGVQMGSPPPEPEGENYLRMVPFGYYYKSVGPYWYPDFTRAPLKDAKTLEDIENYTYWPDPADPVYVQGAAERAKDLHENTTLAVVGEPLLLAATCHVYHFLRGFEQWFIDMKLNPDFYHALMTRINDSIIEIAHNFYKDVGPHLDMVCANIDDMGAQTGPYMSNAMYEEYVKPYHLKYLDAVREHVDPGVKMFYHCDGGIAPLIEEYIDMGYDVISPVTHNAKDMRPAELKKRYGQHITFHSGIDVQEVMAVGSVDDVKRHVTEVIRELAPGGGYIFSIEDIKPEVPPAQIVAAFDTAREVGCYPIA